MSSYSGKTKITARADCTSIITGEKNWHQQPARTSVRQLRVGEWQISAGDLTGDTENAKCNVKAGEQRQEAGRCPLTRALLRCLAVALWDLPSLLFCLAVCLSSIYSQKNSRCLVRKKQLSLENIIKYRDRKSRPEKNKEWRRKRDCKGEVGGGIKTLQNPNYLFIQKECTSSLLCTHPALPWEVQRCNSQLCPWQVTLFCCVSIYYLEMAAGMLLLLRDSICLVRLQTFRLRDTHTLILLVNHVWWELGVLWEEKSPQELLSQCACWFERSGSL